MKKLRKCVKDFYQNGKDYTYYDFFFLFNVLKTYQVIKI